MISWVYVNSQPLVFRFGDVLGEAGGRCPLSEVLYHIKIVCSMIILYGSIAEVVLSDTLGLSTKDTKIHKGFRKPAIYTDVATYPPEIR